MGTKISGSASAIQWRSDLVRELTLAQGVVERDDFDSSG
jgi:hypothetical protein